MGNWNFFQDFAPVKVEWLPGHDLLAQREQEMVLLAGMKLPQAPPMDISDDGDAYSKAMLEDGIEDVDAEDADNPQLVSLYVNPIYSYMRQLEVCTIEVIYSTKKWTLDGGNFFTSQNSRWKPYLVI